MIQNSLCTDLRFFSEGGGTSLHRLLQKNTKQKIPTWNFPWILLFLQDRTSASRREGDDHFCPSWDHLGGEDKSRVEWFMIVASQFPLCKEIYKRSPWAGWGTSRKKTRCKGINFWRVNLAKNWKERRLWKHRKLFKNSTFWLVYYYIWSWAYYIKLVDL